MGYKIYEIEKGLNKLQDKKALAEVQERPGIYDMFEFEDSVYVVHAISDEFKVVGAKKANFEYCGGVKDE